MEYPAHWAIVFSDVVVRSAQALKQYRLVAPKWDEGERFEATLTLSVAQTILAATKELHSALERGKPDAALEMAKDLSDVFEGVALEESTWLAGASGDGFVTRDDLTGAGILEHLRNAVSHPVPALQADLPMTGYTTIPSDGRISGFRFTHSPWVQHNAAAAKPVVVVPGRGLRRFDPEGRLLPGPENGLKVLVLPGQATAYYPLIKLQVTAAELGRVCEDLAGNFERWQKELTGGREPSPAMVSLALSTPLD